MADVSEWLSGRRLGPADLSEELVDRLIAGLRRSGRARLCSPRALSPLLAYPRGLGVAPLERPPVPVTATEVMIARYSSYLRERRGVTPSTVRNYVGVASAFLSWREAAAGGLDLGRLDAAAVSAFVLVEVRRSPVGSAKCLVTRLRALLRFLHLEGEIPHDLTGAVPSVVSWRLASLVKALDSRSLARLLRRCDRRTRVGRRDHAIITMLSRLGLRAGEVAALQLADIDWRSTGHKP